MIQIGDRVEFTTIDRLPGFGTVTAVTGYSGEGSFSFDPDVPGVLPARGPWKVTRSGRIVQSGVVEGGRQRAAAVPL